MPEKQLAPVAIVDYRLGNLYSVKQACAHAGLEAEITSSKEDILCASAVILPGVGAYEDAMKRLNQMDLVSPLREFAASGKMLVGICLGMQLLMQESFEFGRHPGLGIVKGAVVPLSNPHEGDMRKLKVPQIGWNRIHFPENESGVNEPWRGTLLEGLANGEYQYFVHSYIVQPDQKEVILSTSVYGGIQFSSSLKIGNVFACQFHPERSGKAGLRIYQNLASKLKDASIEESA